MPTPPRKQRQGVVYSTNPDFAYTTQEVAEATTLPPAQQKLRARIERAGRGGKTVTLVSGFVGTEADLKDLARRLKVRLGLGGAVKDGDIVIQGDVRAKATTLLREWGYTQVR